MKKELFVDVKETERDGENKVKETKGRKGSRLKEEETR